MERVIKLLPVPLTREEWEERARTVARLSDEIADQERKVDAEKEAAKARVKDAEAVLEGLRARQRTISRVVRESREDREVACEVRLDRRKRVRTVVREDTGEAVESRPLTDAEARDGAEWVPNLEIGLAELRHPADADLVLDTRPLEDGERQADLLAPPPKRARRQPSVEA